MNNIVEMPKRPTWTGILTTMKIGKKITADFSEANTIRPMISGKIKDKYPTMVFETETITIIKDGEEKKYLEIKRTA